MRKKDIPNILSIIRILLVPVFVYLFMTDRIVTAVIVFVVAGITDILDGYIARKYNLISNLGKILDPFADKLMQFSAFVCLYISQLVPLWMPVVYFIKEFATLIAAILVFKKGNVVVKSHVFGKLATFFVFAFVSLVALFGDRINSTVITVCCIAICLYFVFSCFMYAKTEVKEGIEGTSTEEQQH